MRYNAKGRQLALAAISNLCMIGRCSVDSRILSRSVYAVKSGGMPMPFRSTLKLAVIVSCSTFCQQALAQRPTVPPEPPGYLVIQNQSNESVSVYIYPQSVRLRDGRVVRNENWFGPTPVNARESKPIRLPGYEPFDITIRRNDGTDTVFKSVSLRTIMRRRVRTGQTLRAMIGRWVKDASGGGRKYVYERGAYKTFQIIADDDKVAIPVPPAAFPGQNPPPPPPPKGPKR